ncbi:fumarylacetoacetate hydrolase family protein [Streptomyces gamaensis]|uniref:Fumarylacetoacetate hydrolase family protein n=1 Tax=Streptomyces gamaensis TaxID=1763542 RepID=A0ABW0Z724_9ACTN
MTAARITTRVNGEIRQQGDTSRLSRSTARVVAEVSASMTLLPGDVLLTGTPQGSAALHEGDEVEVEIEGLGTLRNPVTSYGRSGPARGPGGAAQTGAGGVPRGVGGRGSGPLGVGAYEQRHGDALAESVAAHHGR